MYYEEDCVKNLTIAYIGGGSRGWAWGFMTNLALDRQMEGTVRLFDIDHEAAGHNALIGNNISQHPQALSHWKYEVASTLSQAVEGADIVVISILPGTFTEMHSDVHAPEAYGIYQSVGDTVGPGGLVRALRTIPMYVEFAAAIRDHCPNAWVINYTNPMTLCVRTLYEIFPEIRAFGCCHEVFGTQKLLAAMLEDICGINGVARQDIRVNVLGINHFTWFDQASYNGMNLLPMYREFSDKYYDSGFCFNDENWMNSTFSCAHRVKFDLFRRYGLVAASGDRHLAEFVPGWYLESPEQVRHWMFGLTTVDWREQDLNQRLERSRRLRSGQGTSVLCSDGEEGHLLIKALLGLGDMISNVNVPNRGAISNLPAQSVVETNALFCRDAIHPITAGNLTGNVHAMVMQHVLNQENTLVAALTCDKSLAFSTFMNDPLVRLNLDDGARLFSTMLVNTRKYLPNQWKL